MSGKIARSALPDEVSTQAMDNFGDSFSYALQLFANLAPSSEVQEERASTCWNHALSEFSVGRLSQDEAVQR